MGEGRLEEKFFVIYWEWGRTGNGDSRRFSATDLGALDLRIRRRGMVLPFVCLSWEVSCCKDEDEPGGLDLAEQREKRGSAGRLPPHGSFSMPARHFIV